MDPSEEVRHEVQVSQVSAAVPSGFHGLRGFATAKERRYPRGRRGNWARPVALTRLEQHPTSRQFEVNEEAVTILRAEHERIRALHERSMKLEPPGIGDCSNP